MNTAIGRFPDDDLFASAFARLPVMAILRGFSSRRTVELCEIAWDVGIELVEIPVQTPEALTALKEAAHAASRRGRLVGAGTVTDSTRLDAAIRAGASFTVAPGFDRDITAASRAAGLPHLPGVATATEIQRAQADGLNWLKAFPAAQLGGDWYTAQHGPFPTACFVATGGIDLANAEAHLSGGAAAVSLGSALADPAQLSALPQLLARLCATNDQAGAQ